MRIQVASDLHLEFLQRHFPGYRVITPAPEADLLILAGDIANGTDALRLFADWPVPVIYVAGNHEFYDAEMQEVRGQLGALAGGAVRYLENDELVIGGVRFLGATLWTDYELMGAEKIAASMKLARSAMRDHEVIRQGTDPFTPADALALHRQSRAWLAARLQTPFDGKTVVVTHHGPHAHSTPQQYAADQNNGAFYSDLTALMGPAALWIHGHTHGSCDYLVNGTRVVCNPCGYPKNRRDARNGDGLVFENSGFQRALLIDV